MSIDAGIDTNEIIDEFDIVLPSVSISSMQMLQSTWLPLYQNGIVSLATLRNQIPGIDPAQEKEYIENEKGGDVTELLNTPNGNAAEKGMALMKPKKVKKNEKDINTTEDLENGEDL
jgi:hypothetical protein